VPRIGLISKGLGRYFMRNLLNRHPVIAFQVRLKAIEAWWDADFSWDGLAKHQIADVGGQQLTLQDFWEEERAKHGLLKFAGKEWTRFHLPLESRDGSERSGKALWSPEQSEDLMEGLRRLLLGGSPAYEKRANPHGRIRPFAALTGVVLLRIPSIPEGTNVDMDFRMAQFTSEARLTSGFGGIAAFSGANFWAPADFTGAKFGEHAAFDGTIFQHSARFTRAEFSSGASWRTTDFQGDAEFDNAKFSGRCGFEAAMFRNTADFRGRPEIGASDILEFAETQFLQAGSFSGRRFGGPTNFNDAYFGDSVRFDGAKLHEVTTFSRTCFEKRLSFPLMIRANFMPGRFLSWIGRIIGKVAPSTGSSVANWAFGLQRALVWWPFLPLLPSMQTVRRGHDGVMERRETEFRMLRKAAEEIGKGELEGLFYAREMDARCNRTDVSAFERLIAVLFALTSSYGQSAARPWLAWLVSVGLWTSTLWLWSQDAGEQPPFEEVLHFSLRQFVPPPTVWNSRELEAWTGNAPWLKALVDENPIWVLTFGTSATIVTVSLIAVFFIVLRRRFALK
jgi:hypothetical protein